MKRIFLSFFFCCAFLASMAALGVAQPTFSVSEKGLVIDGGGAGRYTLGVPGLRLREKDYSGEKPSVERQGDTLVAKYPSGAELKITAASGESVAHVSFSGVPEGARAFVFQMQIPIRYKTGGRFELGKKAPVDFPEAKDKQIVADGWAESFELIDPSGGGFRLMMPGDYQQLQDNRVFGWQVFMYIYNFKFATQKGKTQFAFRLAEAEGKPAASVAAAPADSPTILVDRYGQSTRKDFAGKVTSDEELKADVEKQKAALPEPPAGRDLYGGLAGSREAYKLKKTGFFHVAEAGGRQVLVTPEGNIFFQVGVCGINLTDDYTKVQGREKIYEWLPKPGEGFKTAWRESRPDWGIFSFYVANWIRKYGKPFDVEEWSAEAVTRLRAWGFNSGGAFSRHTETMKAKNFPYVSFLPTGKKFGNKMLPDKVGAAELLDPFVPGTEEALDKAFAETVAPKAGDPLLLGYFLGNEQHFETLPRLIPTYKASKVAAKAELVKVLQAKYKDIEKFNAAWAPAKPFADFEALKEEPLFVRSEAGAADMQEFYKRYMDRYYSMINRAFRKHDPNHLLIGSRLTPHTASNETAVRSGAEYLDVISVNYYTYGIEGSFLKRVHEWGGKKPIILSEWYYSSGDQGLGGGKEIKDQKDRGLAYRNYIEQSAALPYVVGSQWFIYNDQALTGRFFEGYNGEGANTGLVNVADRPYDPFLAEVRKTNDRIYDVMMGKEPPFQYDDPRFMPKKGGGGTKVVTIPRALPGLKLDGTTTNWPGRPAEPIDGKNLVLGTPNEALRGDFRMCWDDQNLYFFIQIKDSTPMQSKKSGDRLWAADGVELFVGAKELDKGGTMLFSDRQVLLGASEPAQVYVSGIGNEHLGRECQVLAVKDVSGDGYVLEAALPWKVLGITPANGTELLFDVAIDNSDDGLMRKQQLMWNGTAKNSGDRGAWGRARLIMN